MLLLAVHLLATAWLAGLVWVVQLVVYPAFLVAGPTDRWAAYHARHSRAVTRAVGPPWLVQGGCVALLLLRDPSPLVLLAAALAATTVAGTVLLSVPLHVRLGAGWDEAAARRLVATNWLRTAAWTAGAVVAAVLVVRGPS